MPDRPVIVNNTPLVALWTLGRLDLLQALFGEVLIQAAVQSEFLATECLRREAALSSAPWIKTVTLAEPRRALAYIGLDAGEAEALALAEERGGIVIMDERQGRRYAHRLRLSLTGTLGVLLLAKERRLLSTVAGAIAELQSAGLYLSPELVSEVLRLAGEGG